MIEILDQSTGNVFAMRLSGKILHRDYQQFVPMLEKQIEEHGSVRCYIEMTDFHGDRASCPLGRDQVRRPTRLADRALCRRRRPGLGKLDDQAIPADLRTRRDSVLRHRRTGQGVGMDQRRTLSTSGKPPRGFRHRKAIQRPRLISGSCSIATHGPATPCGSD